MISLIIMSLVAIVLFAIGLILALEGSKKDTYKESVICFGIAALLSLIVFDVSTTIDDVNGKTRTQAVEYGYAKYEVDSKGKTTFTWIVPTPKVEPAKPAPVKPEPVVVEKN